MKRLLLAGLSLILASVALTAKEAEKSTDPVELEYIEVSGFTDFEYSGMSEQKTGRIFATRVNRYFANLLPKGYRLKLTVTDIDLAGEVEPWRSSNGERIRYVRSHYYPRMSFSWVLYDEEGVEIGQGEERLKDMTFDLRPQPFRSNELFSYELEMMGDWVKKSIRPLVEAE